MDLILSVFKQLGVDQTVFYQFIIFLVLFFIVGPLFFKKLQYVLDLRKAQTHGLDSDISKMVEETEKLTHQYRGQLDGVNEEITALMKSRKSEIIKTDRDIIKKVEDELTERVKAKRKESIEQVAEKKRQLMEDADELANDLVNRLSS